MRRQRVSKYDFTDLQTQGAPRLFPFSEKQHGTLAKLRVRIRSAVHAAKRKGTISGSYSIRCQPEGVYVWRLL